LIEIKRDMEDNMSEAWHSREKSHFSFYLILKGEVAIFTDLANKRLRLLAPDLPEHAYVAGAWLGEAQIPKNLTLELKDVQPGTKTPADYPDMLMILPDTKPHPELAYFEIDVPFPKEILPGAEQDVSGMKVTIFDSGGIGKPIPKMPKRTCLASILVYEWDGRSQPFLLDHQSGRKWFCGGKIALYRSLHVCAAGETKASEEDPLHARNAFHTAASLLGVNAQIDFGGGGEITPTNPPPGLSFHEINLSYFETLELRQALGEVLEGGAGVVPQAGQVIHFIRGNCGPLFG
jgi:hypothetical protein